MIIKESHFAREWHFFFLVSSMADESKRKNRLASGLAVILDGENRKDTCQKNRFISSVMILVNSHLNELLNTYLNFHPKESIL